MGRRFRRQRRSRRSTKLLGRQAVDDFSLFLVEDHWLICCIVDELIWPFDKTVEPWTYAKRPSPSARNFELKPPAIPLVHPAARDYPHTLLACCSDRLFFVVGTPQIGDELRHVFVGIAIGHE